MFDIGIPLILCLRKPILAATSVPVADRPVVLLLLCKQMELFVGIYGARVWEGNFNRGSVVAGRAGNDRRRYIVHRNTFAKTARGTKYKCIQRTCVHGMG